MASTRLKRYHFSSNAIVQEKPKSFQKFEQGTVRRGGTETKGGNGVVWPLTFLHRGQSTSALLKASMRKPISWGNRDTVVEAYAQLKVFEELKGEGLLKIPEIFELRSVLDAEGNRRNVIIMQRLENILCKVINRDIVCTVALTLLAFEEKAGHMAM